MRRQIEWLIGMALVAAVLAILVLSLGHVLGPDPGAVPRP